MYGISNRKFRGHTQDRLTEGLSEHCGGVEACCKTCDGFRQNIKTRVVRVWCVSNMLERILFSSYLLTSTEYSNKFTLTLEHRYEAISKKGFWYQVTTRHSERTNEMLILLMVKPTEEKDLAKSEMERFCKFMQDAKEMQSSSIKLVSIWVST